MPNRNVDKCSDNVSRLENELGFTSIHSSKYVLCNIPDKKNIKCNEAKVKYKKFKHILHRYINVYKRY